MEEHPGHSVEYIRREKRLAACFNNLDGYKMAKPGSVVVELNGDDWLADKKVLNFLNKVYQNENIWITYNTFIFYYGNGRYMRCPTLKPLSRSAVRNNTIREQPWSTSHLHSFRAELATYISEESQIDPATGGYWEAVDDRSQYIPMHELAGKHSRHIYRIMYVYNVSGESESRDPGEKETRRGRAKRIMKQPKLQPLKVIVPALARERT
jgi:hypothetical protein